MTDKIDKILEENQNWKTKSAFMSYIRGGIRAGLWNKSPIKLSFVKERRRQIPNPNPRGNKPTVWGCECEICKNTFVLKDLQVDHIRDVGSSLKDVSDIQQFVEDIAIVVKDELRMVCKECHSIISHSQRTGLSFEMAKLEKEIINISKDDDKVVDKLQSFMLQSSDIPKTKKGRKDLLSKLMYEQYEQEKQDGK